MNSQESMKKYLRYVDYLAAAMLYLKDNFFLRRPLKPADIKDRILGHWGTVPGLNFIYAYCNYLIIKYRAPMLFIAGPGHGAPAGLASVFAEGTLGEFYPDYPRNYSGASRLIKDFSWPGGFPSHLTPMTPGSILEGGELGYSLATAFGAVLDNPELIVACVVGDGEAETGPLAAAWQSNKFLNPAESGAVLPILHDNGYKISGPTIFSAMSDRELEQYFSGLGYEPIIVEGANIHEKMRRAMEAAYRKIRAIQKRARQANAAPTTPRWPMIIFRSRKGWTGVKEAGGKKIEGNFRAHGIPLHDVKTNAVSLKLLDNWLRSYRIEDLVEKDGSPRAELLACVPEGELRMGSCKYAIGGNLRKPLRTAQLSSLTIEVPRLGEARARSTEAAAKLMRDIFKLNSKEKNFRFFCPDETDSNKMGALFEVTGRPFMWPLNKHDEWMDRRGRVMEILSEHTLQGWLQGYLLTGRHGVFATYEAFAMIVASMVDQHAKFLKQAMKVPWRKPISSLNYILTSLGWRQEHNGFSHQNPGFVSSVLEKHGEFASVYFPPDANSMLVTLEDCLKRTNAINIIVAGKQPLPQYLTLAQARAQLKTGVAIWEWAHPGWKNPDVVIAAAGDYMTFEALAAVEILKKRAPALAVRFVSVSELTSLGVGDERHTLRLGMEEFREIFTDTSPIVFNFHGYPDVIRKLLWNAKGLQEISVHGYIEEGTTTTPFDMHVRNQTSRYHLVIEAIALVARRDSTFTRLAAKVRAWCEKKLIKHQQYILRRGKDMDEVGDWRFC